MSWQTRLIQLTLPAVLGIPLAGQQAKVNGKLNVGDATVPPQAEVEVMLVDVSQSKVSYLLISQKKFVAGSDIPINFTLNYDKAKIDQTHDYALLARITLDGRVRFLSDKKPPVITKGNPINVEIAMRSIGRYGASKE